MLGFDLIGSTFSLLQLISDHYYYLGQTTNYLKLSLNAISITFDSVFIL